MQAVAHLHTDRICCWRIADHSWISLPLRNGHWLWISLINTSTQHVPRMLSWRHIGTKTLVKEVWICSWFRKACGALAVWRLKLPEGQTLPREVQKYRLEDLISVSLSTHIFTMNDQIRDGALMDMQDCSNSACHDCSVNFSQLHHGDTDDNVMHILEVGVGVGGVGGGMCSATEKNQWKEMENYPQKMFGFSKRLR